MKKLLLNLAFLGLSGLAVAQTANGTSLWGGQVAYDFAVNKPFVIASYANGTAHSPLILPAWSFSSLTFGGSYIGSAGVGFGEGFQVSMVTHGITLSAALGEGIFTGYKPHAIVFFGASVPVR